MFLRPNNLPGYIFLKTLRGADRYGIVGDSTGDLTAH
jgi:hypothetical protein